MYIYIQPHTSIVVYILPHDGRQVLVPVAPHDDYHLYTRTHARLHTYGLTAFTRHTHTRILHTPTHTHTHTHAHTRTRTHTPTHTHAHAHARPQTRTHARIYIWIWIYGYIDIYIHRVIKALALNWYGALTWYCSPARPFSSLDDPLLITGQQESPSPACRQLSRARNAYAESSSEESTKLGHGTKLGPTLCYVCI